jgi:hypothetical protein
MLLRYFDDENHLAKSSYVDSELWNPFGVDGLETVPLTGRLMRVRRQRARSPNKRRGNLPVSS